MMAAATARTWAFTLRTRVSPSPPRSPALPLVGLGGPSGGAVPEPGTLALLLPLVALFGYVVARRHRGAGTESHESPWPTVSRRLFPACRHRTYQVDSAAAFFFQQAQAGFEAFDAGL